MKKGVLYGIGVGPGDPGLLTLKGIDVIRACPVIAAPRTPGGASTALDIVKQAVDLGGKTVLALDFAMSPDANARQASHAAAADRLRETLDRGQSVAMLSLGDVTVYSSFRYVADILAPEGYALEMIPGVPSFCAAAAALGVSLTDMGTEIHIIPDGDGEASMPPPVGATLVYMKSGRHLPRLLSRLNECDRLKDAMLVQDCGLPGQRLFPTVDEGDHEMRYFSLVIVKPAKKDAGIGLDKGQ